MCNRNKIVKNSFSLIFGRNKSYCRVLVALSTPRLAVTVAFSGTLLAIESRNAEFRGLLLFHVWPQQIVLPSLGGFFWPTLSCNKLHCNVSVALFWPRFGRHNRTAESRWLFLARVWPYKIALPILGGLFLVHVWL